MINLITAIVFGSIALLTIAVIYHFLLDKNVLVERLEALFPEQKQGAKPEQPSGTWAYKLSRIGENIKLPQKELTKYTRILVAAGYRPDTIYLFFGSKIMLACSLPVLYFLLYAAPKQIYLSLGSILFMVASATVGYLLPSYWLYAKKNSRQLMIFHTLPDILDLMTVCVEAGLSMDAALMKTTETPQFNGDPLAQEIRIVTMETRAGKPRIEALKDMAERTMVDDVRAFTTTLAQTEKFGTSLSQALRSYADGLRTKRRQIAEEAAAKTTIKMIFPLILFIFPALLVVILGPAIIQIGKIFK